MGGSGGARVRPPRTLYVYSFWAPNLIPSNNATGPLNQATGPPQSDAGVGIGMLIGDRDYIARK